MKTIQARLKEKHPRPPTMQRVKADAARDAASARNYDTQWRALRAAHLRDHPNCKQCGKHARGAHVDHIRAHRGDDALRLDPRNLQTLCHSCHSKKTAARDGGFGNRRK